GVDCIGAALSQQQGVAVGGGFGYGVGADDAASTATVVDDEGLAQLFADAFEYEACDDVRATAGGEGDDDPDRAVGVGGLGVASAECSETDGQRWRECLENAAHENVSCVVFVM